MWAALLAAALLLALAGCGKKESSNTEGRIGQKMETYFFDFTINEAYLSTAYESYTPREGHTVLVADVTVKNTSKGSIEMYDADFVLIWGEGDDDMAYPITTDPESFEERDTVGQDQLPGTYTLGVDQERTGKLVFEAPAGVVDFSIWSLEMFDDGTEEGETGDSYSIYFTAEDRTA